MADGFVEIASKLDTSGFSAGAVTLGNLASSLIQSIGTNLANALKEVVKTGSEFQAKLSQIQSITGLSAKEMDQLAESAKGLGANTRFSATEAADAMKYFAVAGEDASRMLGSMEAVANLATTGYIDLGRAAEIVADGMMSMKMGAEDTNGYLQETTRFVDTLAMITSVANVEINQIGETMKYVAPVAGSLGYSIEDVGIAIAAMANAGIKGSQAGTSLRTIMTRLSAPTKSVSKAMSDLGISILDSAGNVKPLNELMADLRYAFADLTEEQKVNAAAAIGGQNAMSGLLAIVDLSQDEFDALADSINNASGAAQRMSDIALDNLAGDLAKLNGVFDNLKITIFDALDEPLRRIVQIASDAGQKLQEIFASPQMQSALKEMGNAVADLVQKFADWAVDALPKVVDGITRLINNLPQIISIVEKVIAAFIAWKAVMAISDTISSIGKTVAALSNPITATIAVIGALAAVIAAFAIKAKQDFESVKAAVREELSEAITDINNLKKAIDDINKSHIEFQAEIKGIEETNTNVLNLIDTVSRLGNQSELTATEQVQLENAIRRLNEAAPELALSYDKVTGSLNKSTDAIELYVKQAQAIQDVEVYTKRYNDILEQQEVLQSRRIDAEQHLNDIREKVKEAQKEVNYYESMGLIGTLKTTEARNEANNKLKAYSDELINAREAVKDASLAEDLLLQGIWDAGYALEEATARQDEYTNAISEYEARILEAAANMGDAANELADTEEDAAARRIAAVKAAEEAFAAANAAREALAKAFKQEAQDLIAAYDNLAKEMESAYNKYSDITQNGISKVNTKTELGFTKFEENLRANQEAFANWTNNLALIAKKGADVDFLEYLRGLGVEQSGLIAEIANASQTDFTRLQNLWKEGAKQAADEVTKEFSGRQDEMKQAAATLINAIADAFEDNDLAEIVGEEAAKVLQEMADGFVAGTPAVVSAIHDMGAQTKTALEQSIDEMFANATVPLEQFKGQLIATLEEMGVDAGASLGTALPAGVAEGLAKGTMTVAEAAQAIVEAAKLAESDVKATFDANSDKGQKMGEGTADGELNALPKVESASETLKDGIVTKIEPIVDEVPELTKKAMDGMIDEINNAQPPSVAAAKFVSDSVVDIFKTTMSEEEGKTTGTTYVGSINNAVESLNGTLSSTANNVANNAKQAVQNVLNNSTGNQIGYDFVQGMTNGINSLAGSLESAARALAARAVAAMKSELQISSPSKETYWLGEMFTQGLTDAISDTSYLTEQEVKELAENATETLDKYLQSSNAIEMDIDINIDDLIAKAQAALDHEQLSIAANADMKTNSRLYGSGGDSRSLGSITIGDIIIQTPSADTEQDWRAIARNIGMEVAMQNRYAGVL